MRTKATLFLAAMLILWLSAALVRVENERYALFVACAGIGWE
jgi:hypothetical protein